MTRAHPPATPLVAGLCAIGGAALAGVTLVSPGATRMYAWPWTLLLGAALLAPAAALIVRAFDQRRPLILPHRRWLVLAAAWSAVAFTSALVSPYRAPSLLVCAPLVAGVALFLLIFDALHGDPAATPAQRARLQSGLLLAGTIVASVSVGLWLFRIGDVGLAEAVAGRNGFPLGHSNYTAGLALLITPLAVAETVRRHGLWRAVAAVTTGLALVMLFTSGSRGGLLGLAALAAAGLGVAPIAPRKKWQLALAAGLAGGLLVVANPRTRATFTRGADSHLVAASDVQRTAMVTAGLRMGIDRPALGWGPGNTPLVFPRYRAGLAGGAENVLQLHSTPVHIWAELGLAGVACLLGFGGVVFRDRRNDPIAAVTLAGYAVFALTDWQLDVPVFAYAVATFAALMAPPVCHPLDDKPSLAPGRAVGGLALLMVAVVALVGGRDPTPALNVRALTLARATASPDSAIALLRESLALNSDQEIAHFNLGWLLVVREPAAAERHFTAAAHLVPDKGGVYFGLGLALLNQGKPDAAARAFALECLNDPAFLTSPWWREAAIAATRDASTAAFNAYLTRLPAAARASLSGVQLGRAPDDPGRVYRRTRTGYPVLMRNLDLPAPVDLYDVRESRPASDAASPPLPPKGWLPSPQLIELLDALGPPGAKSGSKNHP